MQKRVEERKKLLLGIDVGSVSISLVCIDHDGELKNHSYALHRGNIRRTLEDMLKEVYSPDIVGVASSSKMIQFHKNVKVYDQQVALMEAMISRNLPARSILHVGAERFFLIELDDSGNYLQTSHSSSCAAGTGSFLDQQAVRLNLEDTSHLSDMALKNSSPIPDIAARCSVFAKTDLIHAQQKGYGLDAICDSLCKGLADNISDTLFNKVIPESPIFMTGGVSKNRSVVRHLQRIIGKEIEIHQHSHLFPALGAASLLLRDIRSGLKIASFDPEQLVQEKGDPEYFYEPLLVSHKRSKDNIIKEHFVYSPSISDHTAGVQVDIFNESFMGNPHFYLGIDIGSTSTKAVLLDEDGNPVSGFYTYTSGQPLKATQAIFEAIDQVARARRLTIRVRACGTTGSGRKFIGGIVGADQVVDEITAHARAAFELNPQTDTIIEIGGQDAKFTQMKNGVVTFSHMNTVCAAGTGSFIEELASRLGVGLDEYEKMAMGRPAPLASDRCTVFMERDINQLLSQGYSVEEVLATVIHSVRENYLKKVASEAHIGSNICFQGATAKNKALVAAFEQRLDAEIYVSPLCHLTGAMGTALLLREEHRGETGFRGLDIYRKSIPVETETCDICLNHCTISVASINGMKQAYGFLCGRDYETKKFVKKGNTGTELLKERKKLRRVAGVIPVKKDADMPVIGIPASLHLLEDITFWISFFNELGIPVQSSENFKDSLKTGKKIAGAEFCAPIDSMYGHVAHLSATCDFVFMPIYLETRVKPKDSEENFCYYTQFSASLAYMEGDRVSEKLLTPMLNFKKGNGFNARQLISSFHKIGFTHLDAGDLMRALEKADENAASMKKRLVSLFSEKYNTDDDVSVVLLGRPYVVLSETLNKGIPDIFTGMDIRAWYQDMLPIDHRGSEKLNSLLKKVPWHFAADILRASEFVARTKMIYPVFITAFKCAPDSFIIEYFKQLMHLFEKPYLIIQIDEHDSNEGYQTRIEAAIRSFRNHAAGVESHPEPDLGALLPRVDKKLNDKILLMPNWDMYVSPLVVANLQRAGYDARILETTEMSIRKSMVHNTGQCLPISIIAQDYIEYIESHNLDPSRVILWMTESKLTCNLRQYPFYIKRILENYGKGMEKASVYSGELTHRELSVGLTYYAYFAYMLGGLFRKVACRIRPYELVQGQSDSVFEEVHKLLLEALSGESSIDQAIKKGTELIDGIRYDRNYRKPLVAIFGDLYVRDNDVMNQDLIRAIEEAGGEALITPYHDYTKIIVESVFRRARERKEHVETSVNRIILNILKFMDDRYYKSFSKYLGPAPVIKPLALEKHLKKFNIHPLHSGESYDNILKIFYIIENYPEVALFVQTNPSFCCAALVTEAMTRKIKTLTGVPIVTITYDGTSERMNDSIVPYIQKALKKRVDQN